MATAGVVFLESSLDEKNKAAGSDKYKPGNTDVIRTMLREQQRDCKLLHANALFREFRDAGQKAKKFGKGYVVSGEGGAAPSVDDFHAEGQTRLFDLIKHSAIKDGKPLKGVWASFGKPYQCLGDPTEPQGQLPKLYRDELAAMDGIGRSRPRKGKAAAASTSSLPAANTGGQPSTTRRSVKSMNSMKMGELDEAALVKHKTIMRFTNNDELDARFPEGPLRQAEARRDASRVRHGAFLNSAAAEAEITDPLLAYGQPTLPTKNLSPIRKTRTDDAENGLEDSRTVVFITQGTGVDMLDEARGSQSHADGLPNARRLSYGGMMGDGHGVRRLSNPGSEACAANSESEAGPDVMAGAPEFHPLSEKALPAKGDAKNPVYGWHNKFMEVRERGRNQLQAALYQRAEGRFKARTNAPMAANMSSLLMADLDLVAGKKLPYSIGKMPANPFTKMEVSWAAQEENRRARTAKAQALDPEELRALQRFYDQLCALVEAQRMSDPLSLMIIHKVKVLLESGIFLTRSMLEAVLEHIASFTSSCGLVRYNKYLLSILTFICKCCDVSEAEFNTMVAQHNLGDVVYIGGLPSHAPLSENPGSLSRRGSGSRRDLSRKSSMKPSNVSRGQSRESTAPAAGGGGLGSEGDSGRPSTGTRFSSSSGKSRQASGTGEATSDGGAAQAAGDAATKLDDVAEVQES